MKHKSNQRVSANHTVVSSVQGDEDIEKRLQESEERYRIMFEHAALGIAHVALDGHWLQINQKLSDILGYTFKDLQGKTFHDITYPEDLDRDLANVQRLLHGEIQTYTIEKRYIHKDSKLIWANLTVSLARDRNGAPLYFISIIEDISARKQTEEKLATQGRQLEAILDALADAMIVYNRDGQILYASSTAQDLFPLEVWPDHTVSPVDVRMEHYLLRDEQGKTLPIDQSATHRILRGETLKGESTMEVSIRGRHSREIHLSITGAPMRDATDQITGGVLIARDVTRRRALERRAHKTLEGLLAMAEALVSLPEDNVDLNILGRQLVEMTCSVLNCSRASLFLIEPQTGVLHPVAVFGLPPDQEPAWWQDERESKRHLDVAFIDRLRNNEVLVIDLNQLPPDELARKYHVKKVLTAPLCIGERLIGILATDYGSVNHRYTENEIALAGAAAKLSALVVERQRLLAERAEAQGREVALQEANQRMEEFLGLASHELRTPLTTIKANIQLSMRRLNSLIQQAASLPEDANNKVSAAHSMLTRAERQVGVLNRLVSDMIDISRIQSGRLQLQLREEPCDLVSIVYEVVQEQQKAQPNRSISTHIPDGLTVPVLADSDRIMQVITNYLNNAIKYSAADKPIEVSLALHDTEARVSVRDYGQGIPPEEQKHIWDCFYQSPKIKVLSGSGVGLGLGLYLNQTLIERHHGRSGVESVPNEGSTFWFTLPVVQTTIGGPGVSPGGVWDVPT